MLTFPVYYNVGLIFIALAIFHIIDSKIVLTKFISEL